MTKPLSEQEKDRRRERRLQETWNDAEYRLSKLEIRLEMATDSGTKAQIRREMRNLKATIRRAKKQLGF